MNINCVTNTSTISNQPQDSLKPTIEIIIEEPLDILTESYIRDIFFAYGLSTNGLDSKERLLLLTEISSTKKTFPYLREIIQSDRHPRTIMLLSSKNGMYIPPRKRVGLFAYKFYLNNIKYYEAVLERPFGNTQPPLIYDIFMAKDRIAFLMKYRDDEILRPEYSFPKDYDNRRDMIENFIYKNVLIYGEFSLKNNSRTSYSTKARVIFYSEPPKQACENMSLIRTSYSATELLQLFDISRGVLWKNSQGFINPQGDFAFHRLSLLHLRQQILEKFGQWRHRENSRFVKGSTELYQILTHLETILSCEIKNDISAYFGNPQLT